MNEHEDTIRDQFTKQAVTFSNAPAIKDEEALQLLVEFAGAGPEDSVLDVACGPGLVACAFASVVHEVTGIDITPAMVERGLEIVREKGLSNVKLDVGDVLPLPYSSASFTIVTCRFAFHHFPDPESVFEEMARVCGPGGRVVLIDVMASDDPAKAANFNRMEKLRDPSHVRAMPLGELKEFFYRRAGFLAPRATFYKLHTDVEGLLSRSFPDPDDAEKLRQILVDSLDGDALGMGTRREGDDIHLAYPIAVLVGEIAAN